MSAFGKFTLGFFLGSLAAAGAVLLFAPKSGIEFQQQIKGYIDNVQSEVLKAQDDRRKELELELETLQHTQE